MTSENVELVSDYADILQVGPAIWQNFDLLRELAESASLSCSSEA